MHFIAVIVLASLLFGNTVHAASQLRADSDNQGMQDIQRKMDEMVNQIVQFWAQQKRLIGTWSTANYYGHLVKPRHGYDCVSAWRQMVHL